MTRREELDPTASLWDLFAVYLHVLRTKHGLSCAAVGRVVSAARQTVSHWESGLLRPDEDQIQKLDALYETGGLLEWLAFHAEIVHDARWQKQHLHYDARSSKIRLYERSFIPGLLQTPEYARALFVLEGIVDDVEGAVAMRMARQERLFSANPPHLSMLIDEDVIDRAVGGREVMSKQLERLLELSELHHIIVQIVPRDLGFHHGLVGPMKIMTVGSELIGFTEAPLGGKLIRGPREVGQLALRLDRIGADALNRTQTRDVIRRALESLK
ncbi:helix-turn-helix domain-containing protein [Actinomadura opuntiae]|uniref:helix-turn-helix domain-containing protein n=1 Tax=Actinomadura sp. OS1-43 TaxID=604315 RepID=UPI00255AC2FA|nr:helix-turn-helix transcriptional regulator [Actinomadura sp. OS1-43]MDL4813360.1 helix-turn-helix transcriptional regulator [Actinomadura sp. OS1-43]